MHAAALALTGAAGLTVNLGHHLADVDALGDAVAVATVGAGDEVVVAQTGAGSDRDCLLACVQVHEARDLAPGKLLVQPLLELADQTHPLVHPQQCLFPNVHRKFLLLPYNASR